jgi:hypothetical protein
VATLATHEDATSINASLSADGRSLTFDSSATNLVPNDTNGTTDVFEANLPALPTHS